MLELAVILAFLLVLMGCLALGLSIIYALAAGYVIFFLYAVKKGFSAGEVFQISLSGVKTVKNLLITFLLIGMLTALWRAAGTIPMIICYASEVIHPSIFLLVAFLLNCLLSVLTGTSFGTAATMGVICMTMAKTMGINPIYAGGAILSGIFFGDRCSPVSTSALLVSEVTGTDLYENIKGMIRTCWVPLFLSCGVYLLLGFLVDGNGVLMDMEALFEKGFVLHWVLVLPAVLVLVLAAFRIKVKKTLVVSIVTAAILGMTIQHTTVGELIKLLFFGYQSKAPELAAMMNGGGVFSMVSTVVIVGLSSSFAGIFEATGLFNSMKTYILKLTDKITAFGATAVVSAVTGMISCNQTLPIILTNQLCKDIQPDCKERALYLENTVVLISVLVPWSIASSVPLSMIGAPTASLLVACYLYLIPVWNWLVQMVKEKRN